MKRRDFLKTFAFAGTIGKLDLLRLIERSPQRTEILVDRVSLGRTGLVVPRIAWGTGTHGWKHRSDQTALGEKEFVRMAERAYEMGIRFIDMADIYGSHRFVRNVLKVIPREKLTLLTKIWTRPLDWVDFKGVWPALDRFRREVGTDYFDIVLLHCQVTPEWPRELARAMEDLAKAKEKGVVRAHGVSCHSLDALRAAAEEPWVEVILARINHRGPRMDAPPEEVLPVLCGAHRAGKGVIGMKVFGCGELTQAAEREKSLRFVFGSGCVDAVTIGFERPEEMVDTVQMVRRIVGQPARKG